MATSRKHYEEKGFEFEFTPGNSGPYQGILVVRAPEIEDTYTAEVYLSKPRSCNEYASRAVEVCGMSKQALQAALNALCSRRYEEVTAAETAQEEPDLAEEAPEVSTEEILELIGKPGVLDRFVRDAARISGVVGEQNTLRLIALGAVSAQLGLLPNGKPIGANIVLIGEPGRGKNFACDAITRLLPEEFCLAFESSSAKSLYYLAAEDPTCLKHRVLYANEAEAIDLLVETVRPLLSGASARHLTVASDTSGRNVGQEFVIEGPATVIICTVRNKLEGQLQSRLLVSGLEDFEGRVAAHSEAVSGLLSSGYTGTDYSQNIRAWTAALRSLTGVRRVVLPVEHPQFRFDSDVVSHGARLWTNFLGLMCTSAWLEQQNRKLIDLPNGETAVVATASDYALAYEVFGKTCERSVINLSEAHRKILNAIYQLQEELRGRKELDHFSGFTQRKIAQRAGVAQSTVSANRAFLVKSVKLLRETSEGSLRLVDEAEPSWWSEDNTLDGFPKPEQVREWWGGDDSLPSDLDSADQTDQGLDDTSTLGSEAEEGDRSDADWARESDDRLDANPAVARDDRESCGDDRGTTDRENPSHEPDSSTEGPVIGRIGDFELDLSEPLSDRSANTPEGIPDARPRKVNDKRRWIWEPAPVALKGLGWSRTKSFAEQDPQAGEKARAELPWRIEMDPAARVIQQAVWWGEGYSKKVWYLLTKANENRGQPYLKWMDDLAYPSTLEEMNAHQERLAAALQGEPSPGGPAMLPEHDGKYLHAEIWEKPGAESVVVFTCVGPDGPEDGEVEKLVRNRVMGIENPMQW